jgi:sodium-coupled neutral amino acid transporter 9
MPNSTKDTAISIANTMIGSSMIVLPVLFLKSGIALAVGILVLLCLVQFQTCSLVVRNLPEQDDDISQTITRQLGPSWGKSNLLANVLLMYIVCIAYFELITQTFYPILASLLGQFDPDYVRPSRSAFVLDRFSYQWAGIYMMTFLVNLMLLTDLSPLLKLLKYSFVFPAIYFLYLLLKLTLALLNHDIPWSHLKLTSPDFTDVAGASALSFLIHSIISPIIKNNADQSRNVPALFGGYILAAAIYLYVGIVGGLACGKRIPEASRGQLENIFDCFDDGLLDLAVQFLIMLQLSTVMPILHVSTR